MDAVITYVNGLDPVWQEAYRSRLGEDIKRKHFRDWGTLKYLLRGIEAHLPFVRNVFLVVSGESQVPEWADREGLKIVFHRDIIPAQFLPVFNSTAIEMYLHRIPGLDEEFIYLNDDFFPVRDCRQEYFSVTGRRQRHSTGICSHQDCTRAIAAIPTGWPARPRDWLRRRYTCVRSILADPCSVVSAKICTPGKVSV